MAIHNFALLTSASSDARLLGFDQQTLVQLGFLFFNTALVIAALCYLLYKPVRKFLKDRSDRIAKQLADAAGAELSASELKERYEAKLRDIDTEREAILEETRKTAREKARRIIDDARLEADTLKNRAMLDIERETENSKERLKKHIIELSALMSAKFVARALGESDQTRLLDEAIRELEVH